MTLSQSLRNGLIFQLGFSEGSGTTTADKSGRGRNGALSATPPTWTTGKFGNAVLFNNSSFNEMVTIPAHTGGASFNPTQFTWMAWVNTSVDPASSEHTVVSNSDVSLGSCSGIESYDYGSCGGRPSAYVVASDGTTYTTVCATTKLVVGTWVHVAATFDGVNLSIYYNGLLQGTAAFAGTFNTSCGGPYRIGAEPGPGGTWGEYFDGSIDDVRLYNRALSAAAISILIDIPVP